MDDDQHSSGFVQLGRIVWIALGPAVLAISAMYIVERGASWNSPATYFYFVTLAAIVLGRWVEVRSGHPLTSTGEPATPKDFYRYVVLVLLIGVTIWGLANAIVFLTAN
jgi:hypothetical protein